MCNKYSVNIPFENTDLNDFIFGRQLDSDELLNVNVSVRLMLSDTLFTTQVCIFVAFIQFVDT